MAGRSRYTTERAARIILARRSGASLKAAAAAGGIAVDTLAGWRAQRPGFALALEDADSAHQLEVLAGLMPSLVGERDPATGEWLRDPETGKLTGLPNPDLLLRYLAHKWPMDFGRTRVEVTGADGGPVETTDPEANRRALEAKLERLAARRGELAGGESDPAPREPETANGGPRRSGV